MHTPMNNADLSKLQKELDQFNQQKIDWLKIHGEQFVLVKGSTLIGTYTTLAEAYNAGVAKFGTDPFLVKQLLKEEPPEELSSHFANAINVCF